MPLARANDSCEIFYEVYGSRGSPIIMIAGMGGGGRFWQPQVNNLSQKHRVIVYDQVGTGRSSRDISAGLSLARMARDVIAVLDAQGIRSAHVVGHAIGGIIGIELAANAPERVQTLTVINGWVRADAHLRRCFDVRKDILVQSGPKAYLRAQPLFLFPPRWISDNDEHLNTELAELLPGFPATATMLSRINLFLDADVSGLLGSICSPTLILASRDDALVPYHLSDVLVSGIKGARLESIDSGAHAFTAVHPEMFSNALLPFLAEHESVADAHS